MASKDPISDFFEIWIFGGLFLSIPIQIVLQSTISFLAAYADWNENKRWNYREKLFFGNLLLVGLPVVIPATTIIGFIVAIINGPGWLGHKVKKSKTTIPKKPTTLPIEQGPYRTAVKPCNECGSFRKNPQPAPAPTTVPSAGVFLDVPDFLDEPWTRKIEPQPE